MVILPSWDCWPESVHNCREAASMVPDTRAVLTKRSLCPTVSVTPFPRRRHSTPGAIAPHKGRGNSPDVSSRLEVKGKETAKSGDRGGKEKP